MDLVCHEHSWSSPSSSSPLQILTAPEKATPAAPKLKKRAGRKVLNETRHPVYRGARRKKGDKWVCEVRETALRGDDAPLISFPDSVAAARLPRPESSSSHQRAASEAARELCPVSSLGGIMDEEVVNPSSSSSKYCLSKISGRWSEGFVDEEAVFNMPALLDGMAEGMLLTPFSWTQYEVDDEAIDFSLWVH